VQILARGIGDVASHQFLSDPKNTKRRQVAANESFRLAGPTGLEPATSGVTGRRSNRLNYDPAFRNLANLTSVGGIPGRGASYGRGDGVSRRGYFGIFGISVPQK
jgi:hypothetical protein